MKLLCQTYNQDHGFLPSPFASRFGISKSSFIDPTKIHSSSYCFKSERVSYNLVKSTLILYKNTSTSAIILSTKKKLLSRLVKITTHIISVSKENSQNNRQTKPQEQEETKYLHVPTKFCVHRTAKELLPSTIKLVYYNSWGLNLHIHHVLSSTHYLCLWEH